jgi:hypothetical protein
MKFTWQEKLGNPNNPYLIRWVADFKWFSIRLHVWKGQDDPRAHHDHAWNFYTFVLWGGYNEITPNGTVRLDRFSLHYRKAEHKHTVVPYKIPTITILLTGPERRKWGFWVNGTKFVKKRRYFFQYGHH